MEWRWFRLTAGGGSGGGEVEDGGVGCWRGAAAGGDDEEGGRLWLAAKVVEVRWGDGGRRDDDGYKVVV
ncbi:hypothetical protein Tco_0266555 [Tanacetum coccineum]